MNPESLIKGKIAAYIVSLMLQEANYIVVNYGLDGIPDHLIQLGLSKERTRAIDIQLSTPSIIVMNKRTGEIILIKVKFVGSNGTGRNVTWGLKTLKKNWPESRMIVVTSKPSFYISTVNTKKGEQETILLKKDNMFSIDAGVVNKYGKLVRKFLGNC